MRCFWPRDNISTRENGAGIPVESPDPSSRESGWRLPPPPPEIAKILPERRTCSKAAGAMAMRSPINSAVSMWARPRIASPERPRALAPPRRPIAEPSRDPSPTTFHLDLPHQTRPHRTAHRFRTDGGEVARFPALRRPTQTCDDADRAGNPPRHHRDHAAATCAPHPGPISATRSSRTTISIMASRFAEIAEADGGARGA